MADILLNQLAQLRFREFLGDEIAGLMGRTRTAVAGLLKRGLRALRTQFGKEKSRESQDYYQRCVKQHWSEITDDKECLAMIPKGTVVYEFETGNNPSSAADCDCDGAHRAASGESGAGP